MGKSAILCIETATNICSVGIFSPDQTLAFREEEGFIHASQLAPFIQDCLKATNKTTSDLSAVAVSIGPGSYTGLRVGLSTAKAIALSASIPLLTISTLASLAHAIMQQVEDPKAVYLPMIDARRMEVYTQEFQLGKGAMQGPYPLILSEENLANYCERGPVICGGDGSAKIKTTLPLRILPVKCSATHLAPLAHKKLSHHEVADIAYSTPFYLKAPNVTKPNKK